MFRSVIQGLVIFKAMAIAVISFSLVAPRAGDSFGSPIAPKRQRPPWGQYRESGRAPIPSEGTAAAIELDAAALAQYIRAKNEDQRDQDRA